jgi:hypothetical protein
MSNNNRKRTRGRYNQTIISAEGQARQIKHPQVPSQSAHDPWGMSKAKAFEAAMIDAIRLSR